MKGGVPITLIDDLYKMASQRAGATVSVACAEDVNVLEAVEAAKGIARFILVGDAGKINSAAKAANADLACVEVVNEPDPEAACKTAVGLIASGRAQALMKGHVDTSVIMKAVLDKEAGMRTGRKLSHLAVFELPTYHKLLFVTDAAINIAPDLSAKAEIIRNAVEAVLALGINMPKVALLAAKEKPEPKMPVTMEAVELTEYHNVLQDFARDPEPAPLVVDLDEMKFAMRYHLDGPLALDNAISRESVAIKGIESTVAGDADILVCPDIEAGNILYKSLAFLASAKNGGVVLGAKRPVILTSRADSAESKLISIALGILS